MCTLVAYDANLQIMPQCFGLFRTETESNWHHFMFLVFTEFPHFRTIISDGTKGLDCMADIFAAHRKIHALCAWHILEKNLKKANPPFKYTKYVFPSCMWSSCRIRYSFFQPLCTCLSLHRTFFSIPVVYDIKITVTGYFSLTTSSCITLCITKLFLFNR